MDPVLIYGFPQGSSMGLVAALEWLGRPYCLCRVDMLGEMREPEYRRINARVETPVLITDQKKVLTETMAIAAWFAARDINRRISFDPLSHQSDRMVQLMAFVNTGFTGAFSPLWLAMEDASLDETARATLVELGRRGVIERHDRMEEMIGDAPYLVGERPTLADALLIGVARWLDFHGLAERSRWPRLSAWRQRMERDPAVRYAVALEAGERPPGSGVCLGHMPLSTVLEQAC